MKENKDAYLDENSKTYASFYVSPTFEQGTITSDGSLEVGIYKHNDKLNIIVIALEKISDVELYELTIQHISKIQNELNAFAIHFGVQAPTLQPITNFLLPNEQLRKDPSNMKLRDYGYTTIIASAIMYGDYVTLGITHSACAHITDHEAKIKYSDFYDEDKCINHLYIRHGYITSDGKFVLPKEAWEIADKNGQIDESAQSFTRYSQNFYDACGKEFDVPYAKQKIKENLELELAQKKAYFREAIFGDKSYEEKRKMQNEYVKKLLHGMDDDI